jgi:hypothetical protein
MDWPYLRHMLIQHKSFLNNLFKQTNVINILNHASDSELNLLLKLLHLINLGQLPLKKSHHEVIVRSRREKKLEQFESRRFLVEKLKSSREHKLKLLKQFAKLFSILLHHIFNLN